MKIYFERSGGITGTKTTHTLDTSLLPPEEELKIKNIINNAKFFDLPSKYQPSKQGADMYQYKITIETENNKHTVEATGIPLHPEITPLIEYLISKITKR